MYNFKKLWFFISTVQPSELMCYVIYDNVKSQPQLRKRRGEGSLPDTDKRLCDEHIS